MTLQSLFSRREPAFRLEDVIDQALVSVEKRFGLRAVYISKSSEGETLLRSVAGQTHYLPLGSAFESAEDICKVILSGKSPAPSEPQSPLAPQAQKRRFDEAQISVPVCLQDGSVHGIFCVHAAEDQKQLNWQKESIGALCDMIGQQVQIELDQTGEVTRLSDRIREIIADNRLRIEFQPIISLRSHEIEGFEVLSRFPDSQKRSTADWFAEAKAVGLDSALELHAITLALQKMPSFPDGVYIAINASPELLMEEEIYRELNETPRQSIVVEVTEHAIVHDYEKLRKSLEKIRPNVRVAVDDTGAGYSSFRHILDLKPDIIKMDATITSAIDQSQERLALGRAIESFAHELNMTVVAEGVENQAEFEALRNLGVDAAQGFYISEPLRAHDAIKEARRGTALFA